MKSEALGDPISAAEVTNVSGHGLWLLAGGEEYFLAFEDFPWFREAPISKILNVEEPRPGHYYWPELDVDLSDGILKDPSKFPLLAE